MSRKESEEGRSKVVLVMAIPVVEFQVWGAQNPIDFSLKLKWFKR